MNQVGMNISYNSVRSFLLEALILPIRVALYSLANLIEFLVLASMVVLLVVQIFLTIVALSASWINKKILPKVSQSILHVITLSTTPLSKLTRKTEQEVQSI